MFVRPNALIVALVGLGLPSLGAERAVAQSRGIQLEWSAPASCPAEAQVFTALNERAPRGTHLGVSAQIERVDDGYELTLQTFDAGGTMGERTLQAQRCTELVSAAVFLVDLAFEAMAPAPPPAPPLYEEDPRVLADPHAFPRPHPIEATAEERPPEVEMPVDFEAQDYVLSLMPAFELGNLPELAGSLEGYFEFAASEMLRFGVGVRGTFPQEGQLQHEDRASLFEHLVGRFTLGTAVRVRRLIFTPFIVGEAGAIFARADGVPFAESTVSPWFALGVGSRLAVRFGRIAIGLELDMRAPLTRPSIYIAESIEEHFSAAPVVGRVGLRWEVFLK